MPERLLRSRSERMIAGVAGGIAVAMRVDPTLVRIGWIVLAFLTQGAAILAYVLLVFVIPEAPDDGTDGGRLAPAVASDRDDRGVAAAAPGSLASPRGDPPRAPVRPPGQLPLVLGVALILIGAWYLVRPVLPAIDLRAMWPLLAVGLGGVLIVASVVRRR